MFVMHCTMYFVNFTEFGSCTYNLLYSTVKLVFSRYLDFAYAWFYFHECPSSMLTEQRREMCLIYLVFISSNGMQGSLTQLKIKRN